MGAGPTDPYSSGYGMPPNPYGGQGYGGHQGMMSGGGHMHGGYGGGMGGMGGSSGRGGVIPFRAGDWKCGNEGCGYHNFAKNVSCLRCGASRNNAAVVAEGGMTNFPGGGNYGGPQGPPNMGMGSMDSSSYGGMTPASSAYGGAGGMSGGYGGQSFGPPSTYALPSGIGAPSPYMAGGYSQMGANGGMQQQGGQQGGFDSRTEQAFNQGNTSAGGQGGYSNGGYGQGQYGDNSAADLSFLSSGMSNLGFNDREPRNGQNNTKSPQ